MAKRAINPPKRYSQADKYLLQILAQTPPDFKSKREDSIKINEDFINKNQQDFKHFFLEEMNKKLESSS